MSLANRTIALAEGRQLEELAQLLEKDGAHPLRCPLVNILDPADDAPVQNWLGRLRQGAFDWIVLLTGEGVRRLLAAAERTGQRDAVLAALGRAKLVTRGPKPGRALKEVGLTPTLVAGVPTTDGVIEALRTQDLRGQTVGVQLYSSDNPPLLEFLAGAGATAETVQPYVYAPASDAERVAELIDRLASGQVDALIFTSSPQVERLFEVARERGIEASLREGLDRTRVASVGPVVKETLHRHGVRVDVSPEQGFQMKNLVQHLKRALGAGQ
jgi:uroporphyrinogen-III synthase